jgi:hypothetical protein
VWLRASKSLEPAFAAELVSEGRSRKSANQLPAQSLPDLFALAVNHAYQVNEP